MLSSHFTFPPVPVATQPSLHGALGQKAISSLGPALLVGAARYDGTGAKVSYKLHKL